MVMVLRIFEILRRHSLEIILTIIFATIINSIILKYTNSQEYVNFFMAILAAGIKIVAIYMVAFYYLKDVIDTKRYIRVVLPFAIFFILANILVSKVNVIPLLPQVVTVILITFWHLLSYAYSIRKYSLKTSAKAAFYLLRTNLVVIFSIYLLIGFFVGILMPIILTIFGPLNAYLGLTLGINEAFRAALIVSIFGETIAVGVVYFERFENILTREN